MTDEATIRVGATQVECRVDSSRAVALETTLLVHGVPPEAGGSLGAELEAIVRAHGSEPATVGVLAGRPVAGLTPDELRSLMRGAEVPKLNTANLGVALCRGLDGATTVSTTAEIAAAAGIRFFATGGIGGVHRGYGSRWDISADLAALARFPVGVVSSGVKSLLDVIATREALETLGVPVVGYRTDHFPAFYCVRSGTGVDARFDDAAELGRFIRTELARTGRGVLICNPVPDDAAIEEAQFEAWLAAARSEAGEAAGRDVTPALLSALHRLSDGRTLEANLALVRSNVELAAVLASSAS